VFFSRIRAALGLVLGKLLLQRRVLGFAFARLDAVLAHGQRPANAVQLEVQTARVADGLALVVAPPQGGGPGAAVGAAEAQATRGRQPLRRLHQRSIHAVHLVVEAARVAKVVAGAVAAPQRRRNGAAVDALAPLSERVVHLVVGADRHKVGRVIAPTGGRRRHRAHHRRRRVVGAGVGCGGAAPRLDRR